jgi:hypothetical protein
MNAQGEVEFAPSWLKRKGSVAPSSSTSMKNSRSSLGTEDIEQDTFESSVPQIPKTPLFQHQASMPAHTEDSPPGGHRASLFSPYGSSERKSKKAGFFRLKLGKVNRLTDAQEARMLNILEFAKGDANDPRTKARRAVETRVLQVMDEPPFVAVVAQVVSDTMIDSGKGHELSSTLASGVMVTAYFKPVSCRGGHFQIFEGAVMRIFDPVVIQSQGDGDDSDQLRIKLICTHVAELVNISDQQAQHC